MTSLISLLMIPAALYLIWRLFSTSRQIFIHKKWLAMGLPLLIGSFFAFPLIALSDFYLSGDIDLLQYPKLLTYWFWFGLILIFQLATWVIIADVIKLGARLFYEDKNNISHWHARVVVGLFVVVFIFVASKTYRNTTTIKTDKITLPIEDFPDALDGFKIVHISDIQGDAYTGQQQIADYIRRVNEQNPDLIIFTGDLISYGTDFIEMSAKEFGRAEAKYGTYAVVGDHDYWAGLDYVESALTEEGIPLLRNENHTVVIDSSLSAVITGVTEVYSKNSNPQIVDSLTQNTKETQLKIFASHQVKQHLIKSSQANGYHMMLAGHTHGGQIRVPFLGMDFAAAERETKYVRGLYRENRLPINVNNGLGFTLGPIRYNAPPNISVIELRSK